ncbi:MAG: DUF3857 domain-containing protein [Saprospiraceae bacterium]
MHYLKKLFFIFFIFISTNLIGQKAPVKWGKVSKEDLAMTSFKLDEEADAVVLCDYGTISFEGNASNRWIYRFTRHKRVKILKSSASDLGNIAIDYYSHKNSENVSAVKAQVILPDGSKQKIKRKDIFTEKINDYWSRDRFAIPNIQEGAVIEYKYELTSDRIGTLRDWYFQTDIPVRHSELRISIPEFFDYIFLYQSEGDIIKTDIDNVALNDQQHSKEKVRSTSYIMKNMAALKEESFITTMNDYRARIKFQLKAYTGDYGMMEQYLSNWEALAKSLMNSEYMGVQYSVRSKTRQVCEAAKPYMDAAKTPMEKIIAAQEFIVNNMAWDGSYQIYTGDRNSLSDLLKKGEAGKGGLNLMLLAILKNEGLNVWPLLSSTRGHGKMFPIYPILDQFSHTMVYVELEGEYMVLDICDAFHPAGYPEVNSLNKIGWVVDKENPRWIDLPTQGAVDKYLVRAELDKDGKLEGNISGSFKGYSGVKNRQKRQDKEDLGWKNQLREKYTEAEINTVQIKYEDDIYKPLRVSMDYVLPEAANINGDFIYFSPIIFEGYEENPFKLEKRNYPVDISYPFEEDYILNLSIPEGYDIEEIPESINLVLPNKGGKFVYLVNKTSESNIQIVSKIIVDQIYFKPVEYQGVKQFFDLIVEKQGEQIVLKKKA